MKKGKFISFIQHPDSINENDINDIQSIVSEFPYFQSAQVLLCKAFYQGENINFESQLRKTAAFSADRKQLHHILYSSNSTQAAAPIDENKVDELEEENIETPIETPIESASPIETEVPKEPATIPSRTPEESAEASQDSSKKSAFLERQILAEAINSSILLEIDQKESDKEKLHTKEKETEDNLQTTAFKINDSQAEDIQSFNDKDNHSFSDWISHFTKEDDTASLNFDKKVQQTENATSQKRAEKKKQTFYSASKMAKLSVQEDGDLVTETLAKIYVAQESFDKAISAYEKLQLKYPEKKVYFAAQIKALKNQLKS